MKIPNLLLVAAIAFVTFAFTYSPVEYKVDKQKSKVIWLGKKVTGEHTGEISLGEGKLITDGKTVTGGTFSIDMNSITCTDLTDAGYNKKFIDHLKADDFFSTAKFSSSTLEITKVTPVTKDQYKVNGNLTIKGITNPIEFPATIQIVNNEVKAKAKIVIDRTKYDIKYGSTNFFEGLGDKAIYDEFELNVDLLAKK